MGGSSRHFIYFDLKKKISVLLLGDCIHEGGKLHYLMYISPSLYQEKAQKTRMQPYFIFDFSRMASIYSVL